MEQLDKIHNLSIAELRKILSDNDVKETNIKDKSELIELLYQGQEVSEKDIPWCGV